MGLLSKKIRDFSSKDSNERLDEAKNALNKGLTGFINKAILGKGNIDEINKNIEQAKSMQAAMNGQIPEIAVGTISKVTDTGKLVNFNPILILTMNVNDGITEYEYTLETLVSQIQIPKIGDKVSLGSGLSANQKFTYLGLKI